MKWVEVNVHAWLNLGSLQELVSEKKCFVAFFAGPSLVCIVFYFLPFVDY